MAEDRIRCTCSKSVAPGKRRSVSCGRRWVKFWEQEQKAKDMYTRKGFCFEASSAVARPGNTPTPIGKLMSGERFVEAVCFF